MSKSLNVLTVLLAGVTSFVLGAALVYLMWQPAIVAINSRPAPEIKPAEVAKPPAEEKPVVVAEPKPALKAEPEAKVEPKPAPEPAPKVEPKPEPDTTAQTPPRPDPALASKPKIVDLTVPRRSYGIGREATAQEIAGWDIDVRPDGQGLPPGSGSAKQGENIYMAKCAACHGEFGEGAGRWPAIAGGKGTLASHDPVKTVGSYFPYLASVFDYVRHTMPFGDAQSMTNDELYSVVAYVLYLNSLVEEDFVLSKETWASVKMPNQAGFVDDDRETTEKSFWNPTPCMTKCKDEAKITGRARAIDVTPDEKPKSD
jgi:hypothetical protein